jgi:hypothetical protein
MIYLESDENEIFIRTYDMFLQKWMLLNKKWVMKKHITHLIKFIISLQTERSRMLVFKTPNRKPILLTDAVSTYTTVAVTQDTVPSLNTCIIL